MPDWLINLAYLVASVLFILGIKGMTHPRTAVRGNLISAIGMAIAIIVTLAHGGINYGVIAGGVIVGSAIGALFAIRVPMTGMPQMVALLNGFGGGASVCVAWAELINPATHYEVQGTSAIALTGFVGAITFWGSGVAWAKLEEIKQFKNPIAFPMQQLANAVMMLIVIGLGVWMVLQPEHGLIAFIFIVIVSSVMGFTLTSPIGGADMPVVIALLNSYSGIAAAMAGFIIDNTVLIITGSLVGASGVILTSIMCKAMNRSLANVIFGNIDASAATATADEVYEGKIKAVSPEEIAMMLDGVQRVVIVPGYGMAVAQAQHAVRDLYQLLQDRGVNVEFAIHPVAGRMPGHMNVLLAEVDIPYDKLIEMDQINAEFAQVDVAIVLGANDVVNPDARKTNSPIAGMPILDVDKARTVIVVKRSLSPGFAGIPNPLFAADNCLMYFADGKKAVMDLIAAMKEN
ncbi:MAG: NAD synthetase [Planctomycetes bacterium]|nr:NAD synthetase [Planctomycetota bacterium]